jgi:hypothetical protein
MARPFGFSEGLLDLLRNPSVIIECGAVNALPVRHPCSPSHTILAIGSEARPCASVARTYSHRGNRMTWNDVRAFAHHDRGLRPSAKFDAMQAVIMVTQHRDVLKHRRVDGAAGWLASIGNARHGRRGTDACSLEPYRNAFAARSVDAGRFNDW